MKGLQTRVEATVTLTAREWQLYTSLEVDPDPNVRAQLAECVVELNSAASRALSSGTVEDALSIFQPVQLRYAEMGAYDTEPSSVFWQMIREVFGEVE